MRLAKTSLHPAPRRESVWEPTEGSRSRRHRDRSSRSALNVCWRDRARSHGLRFQGQQGFSLSPDVSGERGLVAVRFIPRVRPWSADPLC